MSSRRNPYRGADVHTRQAKAQGYPARSVFKLEEIDRRVALLSPGQAILDLGAAPGSWSLYAAGRVGQRGRVLALDLKPITQVFPAWVEAHVGDALDVDQPLLRAAAPFDVVLSDMAPSTTGSRVSDQARSFELFMAALEVACAVGRPGGSFVAKLFMSGDFQEARGAVQRHYAGVRTIRADATRQRSTEVFVVGQGLRAPAPP